MRRNPPHVKRLVNVYTLVRALAVRRTDQLLVRLVDASGALDWEEIRVLRLYTENFNPAIEGELRTDHPHRAARVNPQSAIRAG